MKLVIKLGVVLSVFIYIVWMGECIAIFGCISVSTRVIEMNAILKTGISLAQQCVAKPTRI